MNTKSTVQLLISVGLFTMLLSCQKEKDIPNSESLTATSASAKKNQSQKANTFYGPQVHIGDGKVRSWIRITHDGVPQEMGLEMTEGALQNLPKAPAGTTGEFTVEYLIPLHQKAKEVTPYDHIEIDWQANGHFPPGIFDVPHFDIHFYTISLADQMAIPAPGPSTISLFGPPPAGYLPAEYTIMAAPIAKMGRHWLDATTFPTPSNPFTHVLVYGTFYNKVVFIEPMITRSFLLTNTTVHQAIKQPTVYNPSGTYYPTMYNIYRDGKKENIYITLDEFAWK